MGAAIEIDHLGKINEIWRYFKQSAGSGVIKLFKASVHMDLIMCAASIGLRLALLSDFLARQCRSGRVLLDLIVPQVLLCWKCMVALAIFATAAMTLTKVAMQYTQSTSNAILRTKAQFVALNEVATNGNQSGMDGRYGLPNSLPSKAKPGRLISVVSRRVSPMSSESN